jgi:hypothetical protein
MSLDDADLVCLRAAKHGLIRKEPIREPVGWWALSAYGSNAIDHSKGGPWTAERVARLCELGLLGRDHMRPTCAELTPGGKRAIRPKPQEAKPASFDVLDKVKISRARTVAGKAIPDGAVGQVMGKHVVPMDDGSERVLCYDVDFSISGRGSRVRCQPDWIERA